MHLTLQDLPKGDSIELSDRTKPVKAACPLLSSTLSIIFSAYMTLWLCVPLCLAPVIVFNHWMENDSEPIPLNSGRKTVFLPTSHDAISYLWPSHELSWPCPPFACSSACLDYFDPRFIAKICWDYNCMNFHLVLIVFLFSCHPDNSAGLKLTNLVWKKHDNALHTSSAPL